MDFNLYPKLKVSYTRSLFENAKEVLLEGRKITHMVTAISMVGEIEIGIDTDYIEARINYMLDAYDLDMKLKTAESVFIKDVMFVIE